MPERCGLRGHFLLLGFDQSTVAALGDILSSRTSLKSFMVHSHSFPSPSQCLELIARMNIDVIFCAPEPELYSPLVNAIRRSEERVPVVVINASSATLSANVPCAGVPDCFETPLDRVQVHAILESTLPRSSAVH